MQKGRTKTKIELLDGDRQMGIRVPLSIQWPATEVADFVDCMRTACSLFPSPAFAGTQPSFSFVLMDQRYYCWRFPGPTPSCPCSL